MRNLVLLGLLMALPARAETPYVHQQGVLTGEQTTAIEAQTTLGTRDLRSLGGRGVEQGLRVRHAILEGTTLEAFGGTIWQPESTGELRAGSIGVEVVQRLLSQKQLGFDLQLAGGGYRDPTGVFIPRIRGLLGRSWGRLHAQLTGIAEIPLSGQRDSVDVILGAAAAWQLTSLTALGLEFLGEDLEAIWNPAEAEGGARMLAGPSLHTSWGHLHVHANVAATTQWLPAAQTGLTTAPQYGALGRINLGWRF